jgi:hypothetical protein
MLKQKEARGLKIEELDVPIDEDGHEHLILDDLIESKVVDILKKDVVPNLQEVEGAALRRYI